MSDGAMNLAAAALLAAVLLVLYTPVLNAPYIFDDEEAIQTNASIRRLWPLSADEAGLSPFKSADELPTSGRPLVNFSFALNYAWGGLHPAGYRLVNVAIHFLSAILLMLIVRRTLRQERFAGRFDRAAAPLALLTALLWAVHPLQTEAVAYATQRTELLMAFFYLATLYCSLRYWSCLPLPVGEGRGEGALADGNVQRHRAAWLILAVSASLAGMASKEVMVSVPVVVLLYEWTFCSRSVRDMLRFSWPLYTGLVLTWGLLLYLNVGAPRSVTTGFHGDFTPWVWWCTQAKVFWMYLKLAVWPWPLVIHYSFPLLETWRAAQPWVLATALLLVGTFVLLWQRHPVGFVAASVMVILSPTSLVPILTEYAAERRMYLPLAPLIALVAAGGYFLAGRLVERISVDRPKVVGQPLAVVAAVMILLTIAGTLVSAHRVHDYVELVPLWQDALVHQPDNYHISHNLAVALLAKGRVTEALEASRRTVQKWPERWRGRMLLGMILSQLHQYDEAIESLRESVKLKPDSFDARLKLGVALSDAGQYDEAISHLEAASRFEPSNVAPQYCWGLALSKAGRLNEAVEHFETALKLDANHAETRNNLGVALVKLDRIDEARMQLERAVALQPGYADAHGNLARLYDHSGDISKAVEHYEAALRLQPNDFEIHSKLTTAYVRKNQPDKAIAIAEKAAALARAAGQAKAAEQVETWLREFRAQQPATSGTQTSPN
jgi:tetratricopeptide (TPR) repeat protein